jgi:hypothetical protein
MRQEAEVDFAEDENTPKSPGPSTVPAVFYAVEKLGLAGS